MSIVSSIGKCIGKTAIRATGVAALGAAAYDAHILGKLEADVYSKSNEADRVTSAAYNNAFLDEPSAVMSKVKKRIFKFQIDNNIFTPFERVIGYFKGFFKSCVNSVVPVLLGFGALFGGSKVSKGSALGLLIYGGYKIFQNCFGMSALNRLNPPYK